jgi:hypothetical protein
VRLLSLQDVDQFQLLFESVQELVSLSFELLILFEKLLIELGIVLAFLRSMKPLLLEVDFVLLELLLESVDFLVLLGVVLLGLVEALLEGVALLLERLDLLLLRGLVPLDLVCLVHHLVQLFRRHLQLFLDFLGLLHDGLRLSLHLIQRLLPLFDFSVCGLQLGGDLRDSELLLLDDLI